MQLGPGQPQHVVTEPADQRLDVACELAGLGLGSTGAAQGQRQRAAVTVLPSLRHLDLESRTPRGAALGQAREHVGHGLAPLADVEDVAVAGLVAPSGGLARAQSGARIGDGVVRIESLGRSVEQVQAPGIGVTVFDALQPIAVGRGRVDASEHGSSALEDLVVQADPHGRQILRPVEGGCPVLSPGARAAASLALPSKNAPGLPLSSGSAASPRETR